MFAVIFHQQVRLARVLATALNTRRFLKEKSAAVWT